MTTNSAKDKRLYRQVVEKIMELIESGEYPVGSRLPAERVLATRFGVSRPTIREAVIALEARGIVVVKTGSGVYISQLDSMKYKFDASVSPFEIIEARVIIERAVAALAATMITDDEIIQLRQVLSQMEQENQDTDNTSVVADKQFHDIIAKATHNSAFIKIVEQLWDAQEKLDHVKTAHQDVCKNDIKIRIDEHSAVVESLANRNPQQAREAMTKHFSRLLASLHSSTEKQAEMEMQQRVAKNRQRFSLERFNTA